MRRKIWPQNAFKQKYANILYPKKKKSQTRKLIFFYSAATNNKIKSPNPLSRVRKIVSRILFPTNWKSLSKKLIVLLIDWIGGKGERVKRRIR